MSTLEELANKQTMDMEAALPKFIPRLTLAKEALNKIRNQRLKEILAFAKKNSPWYQRTLAHINVEDFSEEKLEEIPIVTREILMENWDEIITDPNLNLAIAEKHLAKKNANPDLVHLNNKYHVLATSGSSSTRSVIVYNWDEWIERYIYMIRFKRSKKSTTQTNKQLKMALVLITNTTYSTYAIFKTFVYKNLELFFFPMTMPFDDICRALNETQPDILSGRPSIIYRLCPKAEKKRLLISPLRVTTFGEALYPPIRTLIEATWPNASILNSYGTTEGISAFNCTANSLDMHLNIDNCIVEPVDHNNKLVEVGEISTKLLMTNLYNYTQPLIRYEITDQLQFLNRKCACGIEHPLIAEPKGRPEFDFSYPGDVFVHHLTFVKPLLLEKSIKEYQVQQTLDGAIITVVCNGWLNKHSLKKELAKGLKNLGLKKPIIEIKKTSDIQYPHSGKLKRFLPLRQD